MSAGSGQGLRIASDHAAQDRTAGSLALRLACRGTWVATSPSSPAARRARAFKSGASEPYADGSAGPGLRRWMADAARPMRFSVVDVVELPYVRLRENVQCRHSPAELI